MSPPFETGEYDRRLSLVRAEMEARGLSAMVIGDPANINWLTGYDAWSFYTPQMMLVSLTDGPWWMGRLMDAGAANFTTYLTASQIVPYPEELVQRPDTHPMSHLAGWMADHGFASARIGYESDSYYFSPRALDCLRSGLPGAEFVDADLLVNWQRLVKSEAEIEMMRGAARIAEATMQCAFDGARPGVRQCDLMAEVVATQVRGTPQRGGDGRDRRRHIQGRRRLEEGHGVLRVVRPSINVVQEALVDDLGARAPLCVPSILVDRFEVGPSNFASEHDGIQRQAALI